MAQLEMMELGLGGSNDDGKVCAELVQRWDWPGFLVDQMQVSCGEDGLRHHRVPGTQEV